jgi:hypothetical protein
MGSNQDLLFKLAGQGSAAEIAAVLDTPGLDLNAVRNGQGVLHLVCSRRLVEVCHMLLTRCADPNLPSHFRCTDIIGSPIVSCLCTGSRSVEMQHAADSIIKMLLGFGAILSWLDLRAAVVMRHPLALRTLLRSFVPIGDIPEDLLASAAESTPEIVDLLNKHLCRKLPQQLAEVGPGEVVAQLWDDGQAIMEAIQSVCAAAKVEDPCTPMFQNRSQLLHVLLAHQCRIRELESNVATLEHMTPDLQEAICFLAAHGVPRQATAPGGYYLENPEYYT